MATNKGPNFRKKDAYKKALKKYCTELASALNNTTQIVRYLFSKNVLQDPDRVTLKIIMDTKGANEHNIELLDILGNKTSDDIQTFLTLLEDEQFNQKDLADAIRTAAKEFEKNSLKRKTNVYSNNKHDDDNDDSDNSDKPFKMPKTGGDIGVFNAHKMGVEELMKYLSELAKKEYNKTAKEKDTADSVAGSIITAGATLTGGLLAGPIGMFASAAAASAVTALAFRSKYRPVSEILLEMNEEQKKTLHDSIKNLLAQYKESEESKKSNEINEKLKEAITKHLENHLSMHVTY